MEVDERKKQEEKSKKESDKENRLVLGKTGNGYMELLSGKIVPIRVGSGRRTRP